MANTQINITANGTKTLATAGKYCDRNIDVNVAVPASGITPTGNKTITTNGTHDVTNYANAVVNVPVPSGYIKPSGSITITENGTHDVTNYASAVVSISGDQPTQFTNLYDPANVVVKTASNCSSGTVSFSSDNYVNYVVIPYHHKANAEVSIRVRGISLPVRDRQNFTVFAADGETPLSWGQFSNAITISVDEYGDTVFTFKSGGYKSYEWYYLHLNFQYHGVNSGATAKTGPIITINEPIGNGGHV